MNPNRHLAHRTNRRAPHVQIRALDDKKGRFQARVIHYDVVDDYRTLFAPGVFTESLEQRMPRVVWQHDWSEPLGRYIDYEDGQEYLDLIGEFDDFNDVPRARQAYAQLKSGTIDEFSVGFMPFDGDVVERDGQEMFRFTRARLDEVSLVLAGAVPGTELLAVRKGDIPAVRSATIVVPKDFAAQVVLDLHQGNIDLADALQQIKHVSEEVKDDDDASGSAENESQDDDGDADADDTSEGAENGTEEGDDGDGVGDDSADGAVDGADSDDAGSDDEVETPGGIVGAIDEASEPDFSDLTDVDALLSDLNMS